MKYSLLHLSKTDPVFSKEYFPKSSLKTNTRIYAIMYKCKFMQVSMFILSGFLSNSDEDIRYVVPRHEFDVTKYNISDGASSQQFVDLCR